MRRLCIDCRESFTPDDATLKQIAKSFNLEAAGGHKAVHELEQAALADGIGKSDTSKAGKATNELSTTASNITRLWKAHDEGCDSCNHTGYKGRIGIYEVLNNNEEIQKMIVASSTSEEIQRTAIAGGMLTMHLDGFIKALRGETTVEEVLRVTAEE